MIGAIVATARRVGGSAWTFPALCGAIVLLVLSIPLAQSRFDVTDFIVAGDRYVDAAHVPVPITVRPHSDGYDGQFYFRLALTPDARGKTAQGVTFDQPAWRMQRIGYPVLAWLASGGQARWVPLALWLVNLAGVVVIAAMAQRIARLLILPAWCPWAIVAWPGLWVTLVHDTAEIAALALLLCAINAWLAGRIGLYAILAAAASLTRETSILLFGGIFLYDGLRWLAAPQRDRIVRLIGLGAALLPFLLWRQFLIMRWGHSPQAEGEAVGNVTWPLFGVARMLIDCVTGARHWAPKPVSDMIERALIVVTAGAIVGSGVLMAVRLPKLRGRVAGLALGWALMALLLSTLSATGPWIDPNAYFRAFTEFWAVTVILLGASGLRLPRAVYPVAFIVWGFCLNLNVF